MKKNICFFTGGALLGHTVLYCYCYERESEFQHSYFYEYICGRETKNAFFLYRNQTKNIPNTLLEDEYDKKEIKDCIDKFAERAPFWSFQYVSKIPEENIANYERELFDILNYISRKEEIFLEDLKQKDKIRDEKKEERIKKLKKEQSWYDYFFGPEVQDPYHRCSICLQDVPCMALHNVHPPICGDCDVC